MQAPTPISTGQAIAPPAPGSPTLWAVAGFALYLVSWPLTIIGALFTLDLVAGLLGLDTSSGTIGLSVRNAFHPPAWGLAVALVALPIGRRLVPGVAATRGAWVVLVVGLAIGAVVDFLVIEFVRERFGYYDPEATGWLGFAPPALVAVALAGWAALSLPPARGGALAALTVVTALTLAMIILPSLPGASDGIDAPSVPLVASLGVAVVYAGLVVALAFRHARRARAVG